MKVIYIIGFIIIMISNINAEYWSSSVVTNSSSWYIYRQSQTLNFNLTSSVTGNVSPVDYHGRNLISYGSYYSNIKENDVELKERTSAQEGSYKAREELALYSDTSNQEIDIFDNKPVGSYVYDISYKEEWPVFFMFNKYTEYSGRQINDHDFEGNNKDYISTNLLYNQKLKKEQKTRMLLENMNATVLSTNEALISVNFEPNKYINYQLNANSTGIADMRYRQSGPLYNTKRQSYYAVLESRETYYGTYVISRKMQMKLEAHDNHTTEDEWRPCCYGWLSDRNGILIEEVTNYSRSFAGTESSARFWLDKGFTLIKSGNYSEALAAYERVIEITPLNSSAWNQKGAVLALMGRQNESLKSFDKAIETDPHYAPAWYNKGRTFAKLGRNKDAIKAYDKAIEIDPQNPLFWFAKGNALEALNRATEVGVAFAKSKDIVEASPVSAKSY